MPHTTSCSPVCPSSPPPGIASVYPQIFRSGFYLGSTPEVPYEPYEGWSVDEKRAYSIGFDTGVDAFLDSQMDT